MRKVDDRQLALVRAEAARLFGSLERVIRLLGRTDTGGIVLAPADFPDPNPDPGPPPADVDIPDLAVELNLCPGADQRVAIITALKSLLVAFAMDVDVRPRTMPECREEPGEHLRLALWASPATDPDADAARDRTQELLDLQPDAGQLFVMFAAFFNTRLLRKMLMKAWDSTAKEYDHDGNYQPGGPIKLTGIDYKLTAPDKVTTRLSLIDDSFWPDLAMTIVYNERIFVRDGHLAVDTQTETEAESIGGTTGLSFVPFFNLAFLVQAIVAAVGGGGIRDNVLASQPGGLGAAFVALFPTQFLTPSSKVLVIPAETGGVEVGPGGITIKGGLQEAQKTPSVRIVGPAHVFVTEGTSETLLSVRAVTTDLFDPQLTWTSTGTVIQAHNNPGHVLFKLGATRAGTTFLRSVAVTATDAGGFQASASFSVTFHVIGEAHPTPRPPLPRLR